MADTRIVIKIDCEFICDWDSFHACFADVLGFPDFYGKNMNAWIDCVGDMDDPGAGMTSVHVQAGGVVLFQLVGARSFRERCEEQFFALIEAVAFLNGRDGAESLPTRTVCSVAIDG
ncbi:MAG: barstar family protein [Phycisphaerales bacterium]|nr:barstar family protein [Phycisphaerales bacterium]MCB9835618.1 barstar family protein [Phycisphaera sp.]